MAHSDTYIDPALPISVARVSKVTGNPMLDVGYQCMDARPYFVFDPDGGASGEDAVMTALHPSRCAAPAQVGVYTSSGGAAAYQGTGTQNGGSLSFGGRQYSYGGEHLDLPAGRVNKWSKCKPIRYGKDAALTDTERQGTTSDRSEGYWYGVNITVQTDSWAEIHDVPFDYRRPRGGSFGEPFRLTDFSGYDHAAVPNLYGMLNADFLVTDVDIPAPVSLDIDYGGANSTGLDFLSSVVRETGAGSVESAFSAMYAMVLLDGWAAAMKTERNEVSPVYDPDREAWNRGFNFSAYSLRDLVSGGLPTGSHRVSVFLARQTGNMLDVSGEWFSVAGVLFPSRAFAVPGATGLTVRAMTLITAPAAMAFGLTATADGFLFSVRLTAQSEDPVHVNVTTRVGVSSKGEEFDLVWRGTVIQTKILSYRWREDFHMMVMPGQTVSGIDVMLYSYYQAGTTTAGEGITDGSVIVPEG